MGAQERLTPEQSLDLFISCPQLPGRRYRHIEIGEQADLCLLDAPWHFVRNDLNSRHCRVTISSGQIIMKRTTKSSLQYQWEKAPANTVIPSVLFTEAPGCTS